MSNYDDRFAVLERKVAMLELRRMHDERRAQESTPSAQAFNLKEINENMTILLGIITKQEETTGELRDGVNRVERRLGGFDRRLEDLDGRLISFEQSVNGRFDQMDKRFEAQDKRFDQIDQRFEAQDKRFDQIDQRFDGVDQHLGSLDKKFDQVLLMLSKLTSGPRQET
jgi:septal ring factor EnvC (AmiA/AmiB activator)